MVSSVYRRIVIDDAFYVHLRIKLEFLGCSFLFLQTSVSVCLEAVLCLVISCVALGLPIE